MTSKEVQRYWKTYLEEVLPERSWSSHTLYLPPAGPTFAGINFDRTDWGKTRAYVSPFLMVLSVPTDFIHLTYSGRVSVNGGANLDLADEETARMLAGTIRATVAPYVLSLQSVQGAIDRIEFVREQYLKNPMRAAGDYGTSGYYLFESLAHLNIWANDYGKAAHYVELAIQDASEDIRQVPWKFNLDARLQVLKNLLEVDSGKARDQLLRWGAETVKALKIQVAENSPFIPSLTAGQE